MNTAKQNKEVMSRNIRKLIASRGLNVKDFAAELGFKYTTVLDWVNGKTYPRIDKIESMAKFFNVDKSFLVEDQTTKDTERPLTENQKLIAYSIDPDISDEEREDIMQLVKIAMKNRRRI